MLAKDQLNNTQGCLPNDTHSRAHQGLAAVLVAGDESEDLEDSSNILLESLGWTSISIERRK
jgi:hypothetical protein